MLDLESAIKHCEEVAEEQEKLCKVNDSFNFSQPKWKECANEHRQLAEWLRKYQKIEQILDNYDLEAWEILEKIKEVVRA
jgi:hypothetical protein